MIGVGDSIWTVGSFGSYYRVPDSASLQTVPSESGDGFAASARFTPHEFVGSGGSIMSTPGWELGLVDGGLPYINIGSDGLTGDWGVLYGEEKDIAWNFRRFSDHNRLQLLIDGEICGERITSITGIAGGLLTLDGGTAGTVRNVRVYSESLDARDYSRDNGFSEPVFQVDAGVPPESENKLIFRFYESVGMPFPIVMTFLHFANAAPISAYSLRRAASVSNPFVTFSSGEPGISMSPSSTLIPGRMPAPLSNVRNGRPSFADCLNVSS
jgi:hypothetical protein